MDYTFVVVLAISLVAIIVAFLLMKNEKYTKSAKFVSGNNLMLMDSKGDIVFQPVSDIDTSINVTSDSLNTDMSNNFNNFRIASNSLYAPVGNYAYKTIVPPAYQPAGSYQVSGNYVKYGDPIGLQLPTNPITGQSSDFLGRTGAGAGFYSATDASKYNKPYTSWTIGPAPVAS